MDSFHPTQEQLRLLLEHLQKEQPYFFIGMLVGFLTGFRKDQILLASLNGDCVCGINQSTFVPSLQLKGSDVDQRVLDWMLDHFPDGPQLTFSGITPLQHSKLSSIISWNWAEGDYQTCVYRGTPPPVQERWTLGDDEYVLTRIQPDDVALIEQLQTVEYPDGYLHSLATKSPFCELGAVIRCNDQMVGWCLTHDDMSLGLISTVKQHRHRGIASRAVAAVLFWQFQMFQRLHIPFFAVAHVHKDNTASTMMLLKLGFVADVMCGWFGGKVSRSREHGPSASVGPFP